jgi:hypothetical protein
MKIAHLLTARDKVRYVGDAVKSMFMQTYKPLEILLSDQGSVDGTGAVMDDLARTYGGPHTVRRLQCPVVAPRGMPGLNEHINWAMTQTDADVVVSLSADDYDLAQRVELVAAAFEVHKPSMVLGGMYYVSEKMEYQGETPWPQEDGWCKVEEMFPKLVGGSTIQSWSAEFFHKVGGLSGVGSPDVVLPLLACLDKGAWYSHTRAHCYRRVIGPQNTGLESIWGAHPENSPQRLQLEELMHFQVMAGHYATLAKMYAAGLRREDAVQALASAILDRSASWVNTRQKMSFAQVPPIPFKTA